jgi:group I intron endonuclease
VVHSEETRAKISDSKSGANNPMYGRTGAQHPMYGRTGANHPSYGKVPANAFQSGANNPMYGRYGITPTNAMTIDVYDLDNVLVRSFTSQIEAAKWLGVSNVTVSRYIKSRKVWNNKYTFRKSS